ncbi:MAG: hypothetical protein KBD06_02685 [Candidatus Pacebacteria bacterium]|nr:hypothetical protein [Candidatus Paceibacterota bacterium]
MTLSDMFSRLGLPKHSDTIYSTLEKEGPSNVSTLSHALDVHRPALYRALDALAKCKLVEPKRFGKRTFYVAAPRHRIATLLEIDTKESAAVLSERHIEHAMQAIRYFEGDKGITAVFTDVLEHCKRGDTFYRYTSERDLDEVNKLLPADYRKRRDAKHLERQVISNPESGKRKRSRLERFIKFLGSEADAFRHNAIQLVYGSRIAFIDLNAGKSFIIDNSTLADFQKTIFKSLYKRL